MPTKQALPLDAFWSLSNDETLHLLASKTTGLGEDEVAERIKQYGTNELKNKQGGSGISLFLSQFKSPITIMLIIAAFLSAGLADFSDTIIILIIVLISGLLGFWQENGANNAVKELLKMVQLNCNALRNGVEKEVPFASIVPGDVICLSAGDIIPGDCLLLQSNELFVDEAAFTGESFPVEKNQGVLPVETTLMNRSNTIFMGSSVISGKATAVIIRTGKDTEFGKISAKLQLKAPETDFEKGIRKFGYMLLEITLVLVILIFAINVLLHKPVLDSFLFSLALAVGLTPQLLPAIISINLSAGASRMARQKVVVKRLSSIENLGSMNVLCSDKTGTLTEGKVSLKEVLDINGNHSDKLKTYAWLNATMQQGFQNPIDKAIGSAFPEIKKEYDLVAEIPYDFIRKRLSIQVRNQQENLIIIKGALNNIIPICSSIETSDGVVDIEPFQTSIQERYQSLSNEGYRTLGLAYKNGKAVSALNRKDEKEMIFLGFITFFDPPKANVEETIQNLEKAGVKIKIITGDNALVTQRLGIQIGLNKAEIITGSALQQMTDAALVQQVTHVDIFAEMEPNQKERIISALKKAGYVVGFLGDGINDASALHTADVGISVDSAVDVAKEAADIVLFKRDLNVLYDGIMEGRKTFANTMKYIFMATSANFGNMFSMAGASLFLPFLPLLPKQILLTNLLTDLPETAIAKDNVDMGTVQLPQSWDLHFIQRFMIVFGLLSSVFDYLTFAVLLFIMHADEKTFQTGWFTESVLSAILIVLVIRTRLSFFKSKPGKLLSAAILFVLLLVLVLPLTPMAKWFGFTSLPLAYYGWILLVIVSYILTTEYTKRWFYKRKRNGGA